MTLRTAIETDIPAIVALLADDFLGATREAPTSTDLQPYRRAFRDLDGDPAHLLLVAVDGATVVATTQLSVLPGLSRNGALRAQIEAVRVAETHRGLGLGTAIIQWAIAESRRRGCALVQLTTDNSRLDAHRFYEGLGFVASHVGFKLQLV